MHNVIGLVTIILLFGTPIVGIICGTLISLRKKRPAQDPEETKIMQEIHHGLSRMEKRIEALETILFDHERRER